MPALSPHRSPARLGFRRAVLVLGVLTWLGPFALDAYSPAFPAIAAEYGTGEVAVQFTLTALVAGLAAGQLVAGPLTDAHGRRRPLLVALGAYTVASLGCALAPEVGTLVAARFAQGATVAMVMVVARAAGRDLFDGPALARFYSVIAAVTAIAPAVGPLVGSQVLAVSSWRAIFVLVAVMAVLAFVLAAILLPETAPRVAGPVRDRLRTSVVGMRGLIADRDFRAVAVTLALSSAVGLTYLAGAPFVLQDAYGMTPQQYGLVFVGNAATLVVAANVSARLARRRTPRQLAVAGLAMQLPAAVLVLVALTARWPVAVVLPALVVVIFAHGLVQPNLLTEGMAGHRERAGSASALLGVAQFLLGGALAPVVGLLPDVAAGTGLVMVAACAGATAAVRRVPGGRRNRGVTVAPTGGHGLGVS